MTKLVYLVAVDGSKWSERAAVRAVTLASKTGAEVHFITVVPWSGYQPLTIQDLATRPLDKKLEEKAAHADILDPLAKRFAGSDVKTTFELFWGKPVDVIHQQAKKEHVNMIFVGRRGHSRLADLIIGSVANSLAHTVGVPIVLVP